MEQKLLAARIAILPLAGVGIGLGVLLASLLRAAARNPTYREQLFSYAILGAALTEAIGLFALMMAFLILLAL